MKKQLGVTRHGWRELLGALVVMGVASCAHSDEQTFETPSKSSSTSSANPSQVVISPKLGTLQPGEGISFAAFGITPKGDSVPIPVQWSATGGTISNRGEFSANQPGAYWIVARLATQSGVLDSARVVVVGPDNPATRIEISPKTLGLKANESRQFVASVYRADGSGAGVPVFWSASIGTVDLNGVYTAPAKAGEAVIIATVSNGIADTAHVTVTDAVLLTALHLTPAADSVIPGGSLHFSVSAEWSDGSSAVPPVDFTATGGVIDGQGTYTATSVPGEYTVTVRQRGGAIYATAPVKIRPEPILGVEITPKIVRLTPDGTQLFSASGRLSGGRSRAQAVVWTATGGTITPDGEYTAGSTAGSYQVVATATDTKLADTAMVVVAVPSAVLTRLMINPSTATLGAGGLQHFVVTGTWSDGSNTVPPVTWSATGGTITNGDYRAGSTPGTYRVIAQYGGGALADTSTVIITAPTLAALSISPSNPAVTTGQTVQFGAFGTWSDGSTAVPAVTWTATGGTIDASGLFTAGTTPGTYRVIARQQGGGQLADTALVTVNASAAVLQQVQISPNTVSLQTGKSQQFRATGVLSNGALTSVRVSWSATGGQINSLGRFTAGNSGGTYRVVAKQTNGALADTATVVITPPAAELTGLVLTPATATVQVGGTLQMSVAGVWTNGGSGTPDVVWTVGGGSINGSGLYTAGSTPGTYSIIVTQQGGTLADTSQVTVTAAPPVLQKLVVSPEGATVTTGGTQNYTVSGVWSNGGSGTPSVTWSATGGTITSVGVYTARNTPGTYRVIAKQQGGTLADTVSVTVTSAPAPTLTGLAITPKTVNVQTGLAQTFSVAATWSDGGTTVPALTWSATGGTITSAGVYTAGTTAGTYRVIVKQQGGTLADTASVTVTAPTVTRLTLTPKTATVVANGTQQYATTATWSDGVSRSVAVTYSATGGTVSVNGLYTAGKVAGTFAVIATCSCGKADTASVIITAPLSVTLTALSLTPTTVTLTPGGTQQFSIFGQWSDGSTTAPVVSFSATGGTITSAGLYTAPSSPGTYQVTASYLSGLITATSTISVQSAPTGGGSGIVPLGSLLNTNFDDGTLGVLTSWGSPAPRVVSDATARGGKAVQFDWRSGDEQNIGLLAQASAGKKVHVRVRYKQGANADNSGIKKTIRIRATIDGVSDRAVGTLDIQWGGWNFFGDDFGDGDNHFQTDASRATAGPDTFRGVWRYIELMVDYSTVGYQKAKVWVDGVLVLDTTVKLSQNVSSNMNIDWVYLASVFNGPSDTRSEWFDDLAVSTDYIGVP